jgi:hypothetical protein
MEGDAESELSPLWRSSSHLGAPSVHQWRPRGFHQAVTRMRVASGAKGGNDDASPARASVLRQSSSPSFPTKKKALVSVGRGQLAVGRRWTWLRTTGRKAGLSGRSVGLRGACRSAPITHGIGDGRNHSKCSNRADDPPGEAAWLALIPRRVSSGIIHIAHFGIPLAAPAANGLKGLPVPS